MHRYEYLQNSFTQLQSDPFTLLNTVNEFLFLFLKTFTDVPVYFISIWSVRERERKRESLHQE